MNRSAYEFHVCRSIGMGVVRSFFRALDYGWPDVWRLKSRFEVTDSELVVFLMKRNGRTLVDAERHLAGIKGRDRRRLRAVVRRYRTEGVLS